MNKSRILYRFNVIRAALIELENMLFPEGEETVFSLDQLVEYDPKGRSRQFFYNNIKTIPHTRKGRNLQFKKTDIDNWLANN